MVPPPITGAHGSTNNTHGSTNIAHGSTNIKFDDIAILQDFSDVFLEKIPGLPPKRDMDFTIELVPGDVPNSEAPYRMNILELNDLKLQLQELIDKLYIRPSVSPCGVHEA